MTAPIARWPDAWMAPYLVEAGMLTAERLETLAAGTSERLWDALVQSGRTTEQQLVELLAERFRIPVADLDTAEPRCTAVLPESQARKYQVVALSVNDREVVLATAAPHDLGAEQELGFITGRNVHFAMTAPAALADKLDELYRPENSINRLLQGLARTSLPAVEAAPSDASRDPALDAPMARLVDAMIADAVRSGASDIHAEIDGAHLSIRYRVDGILREIMRLPEKAGPSLVRRVKIIAGLDVTNAMTPQDGRSTARVDGQLIDLRVATAPVARRGEKLVIRILNKAKLRTSIPDLALPSEEEAVLMKMLGHREGMVLVTGPTGSGKTTTLYAVLNHLRTGKVNIVTVEDPVEYDIDGISQMQVNEAQGFTFATALRSVLRQDPDIVLVGEIRDAETATIAIQAGLTGHFVFSTLHTNDAVSAIVRLRDMGVDAFKIGAVLRGILAQRLVRRLCERCAEPLPEAEVPADARPPADYTGRFAPRRPVGCRSCGGSGYRDRIAVLELLPVEAEVGHLIESGAPPQAILAAAAPHGLKTLWESGLTRFWLGLTSFEEMHRVLGQGHDRDAPGDEGTDDVVTLGEPAPATAEGPGEPLAAGAAPAAAPPAVTRTVLVADDDPQMRRLIKSLLQREGLDVLEANDGLDALDVVAKHHIDLILLDQEMPRLTGLGVLEELRAELTTAAIPIIMLTAHTDTETEAFELGAQDYLAKPVQPRSLVARVKAVLRRSALD
jgi:type IV pilus assembly protein PilB